jgi:hypothetical protein
MKPGWNEAPSFFRTAEDTNRIRKNLLYLILFPMLPLEERNTAFSPENNLKSFVFRGVL